jgi:hypothetical protein
MNWNDPNSYSYKYAPPLDDGDDCVWTRPFSAACTTRIRAANSSVPDKRCYWSTPQAVQAVPISVSATTHATRAEAQTACVNSETCRGIYYNPSTSGGAWVKYEQDMPPTPLTVWPGTKQTPVYLPVYCPDAARRRQMKAIQDLVDPKVAEVLTALSGERTRWNSSFQQLGTTLRSAAPAPAPAPAGEWTMDAVADLNLQYSQELAAAWPRPWTGVRRLG